MKYKIRQLIKNSPYDKLTIPKKILLPTQTKKLATSFGIITLIGTIVPFVTMQSNQNITDFIEMKPSVVAVEKENLKKEVMPFITLEFLQELQKENERLTEERKLIQFYADVYGLDGEKVYQKLSELTNHFTEKNYVENNIIGDSIMKGQVVDCETKEKAILIAVRTLAYAPEKYGLEKSKLYTGKEYQSELDYTHQIAYVSNIVGVDPALNYAICRAECSFNSTMFLEKNNPSGIKYNGKYAIFPSTMAGFIDQALELLIHKMAGRTTIEAIGSIHASVEYDPINASWVSNVKGAYYEALQNYEQLFGDIPIEKNKKYF